MAKKATISAEKRMMVLTRDNFICRACGFGGSKNFAPYLDADHIVSESRGGTTDLDNLQCLCKACNGAKWDRIDYQFRVRIATVEENVWALNQGIVRVAMCAKTESDRARTMRRIK